VDHGVTHFSDVGFGDFEVVVIEAVGSDYSAHTYFIAISLDKKTFLMKNCFLLV
jgi:hypothetical protein